jgi:hypothetical protein
MKKYYILFALILIQGCSSGGGDSAPPPTAPDTVFQLFQPGAFTTGFSEVMNYTGTDTAGGVWKGVVSDQTQLQSTFLGQPAIPILSQVQLTNTANGAVISNIGTAYYSTSATDRHYLGYSDSFTSTVLATTTAIPETAKIGDFGVIGTYTDNAGSVDVQSWRLDDGGSGRAKIVQLSTESDQFGTLELSTTTTTLIDTSGNTISRTLVIFFADINVTLTLNGS